MADQSGLEKLFIVPAQMLSAPNCLSSLQIAAQNETGLINYALGEDQRRSSYARR